MARDDEDRKIAAGREIQRVQHTRPKMKSASATSVTEVAATGFLPPVYFITLASNPLPFGRFEFVGSPRARGIRRPKANVCGGRNKDRTPIGCSMLSLIPQSFASSLRIVFLIPAPSFRLQRRSFFDSFLNLLSLRIFTRLLRTTGEAIQSHSLPLW